MPHSLVSILMPAYNAEPFISDAIKSVLLQSYPHWELIIVNDGSNDNTGNIASMYTDQRIKLVHQENAGEAAARNTALNHIKGDVIAFLDADDVYGSGHLQGTVSYLEKHADIDAVYTDGFYINERGARLIPISNRRRGPFRGNLYEQIVKASDVFGPPGCVVIRAESVTRDHLIFDTNIGYGTDWDFFTRFSANAQFGYIDQTSYLYRIHQTNLTLSTNTSDRYRAWAICRSKATKMEQFKNCSYETKSAVFYDLLIVLLNGLPMQQDSVIEWAEFAEMPTKTQARLLRLMASKAILGNGTNTNIKRWVNLAQSLNRLDLRGRLLSTLYKLSPPLCRQLLRIRTSGQSHAAQSSFPNIAIENQAP